MTKHALLSTVAASLLLFTPALAADPMPPEKGTPSTAGDTMPPTPPTSPDPAVPAAPHEMPTKGASTSAEDLPAVPAEAKVATTYANKAAIGDMYEIKAAEIAKSRSENADVKAMADMISVDHTAATAELTPLVTGMGGTLPTELDADHQAMIKALDDASSDDFDKVYVDQQVTAHKEALALHRFYAANGDTASLKAHATKVIPKIEMHLQHAMGLQSTMSAKSN